MNHTQTFHELLGCQMIFSW